MERFFFDINLPKYLINKILALYSRTLVTIHPLQA